VSSDKRIRESEGISCGNTRMKDYEKKKLSYAADLIKLSNLFTKDST
jgi:hypothetical protein